MTGFVRDTTNKHDTYGKKKSVYKNNNFMTIIKKYLLPFSVNTT